IKGLVRLAKQGRFTEASACKEPQQEFKESQNPVGTFLSRFVTFTGDINDRVAKGDLHQLYLTWANARDFKPITANFFGKQVRGEITDIAEGLTSSIIGVRSKAWLGIKVDTKAIMADSDLEL
ncbi:hypothetical protein RZS08_11420, partial [Arthrospira platensis SPKY1]|nr:hypothetical protein [Arthrospira platensis SPKY1]